MKRVLPIFFAILVSGCASSIRVYTDYDRDVDIQHYTTYGWLDVENIEAGNNPLYYNQLNDKLIKAEVDEQLQSKGYKKTEENPELILHYHIVVENMAAERTDPYGYYHGSYWLQSRSTIYHYTEGTLIIDLMDAKTNALVWRGLAVAAVDGVAGNTEAKEKLINDAIKKIFKEYPFQIKK